MSGPAISRSPRPRTGSGRAGRRRERGVSWVTLLLLLIVAGVGYLGYVWAPIYYDHLTVKQTVTDYMNQAVKNRDDAALREAMLKKLARIQVEDGLDAYGHPARVPAIQVEDRALTWDRDVSAKSLHVAFDYDRQVVYPFLNRTAVKTFTIDLTTDLTVPDWGLSR